MMKHCPKWILTLMASLAMVSISPAQQCLSPSPTTLAGGRSYDPIRDRELTREELATLQTLFKSLNGEWRGVSDTFFCKSISDPDDVEPGHFTIKASVRVDRYGNLLMEAELYDPENRSSHQKTLRLYLNNKLLRIDHDTGAGDVELIEVGNHKVAFLYRRVNPTGKPSGSSRSETFFTLSTGERSLTIDQQIYIQAKLSSGYTWQLQR